MEELKFNSLEQVQELQRKKKLERLEDNKLLKDIEANKDFGKRNKDKFMEGEPKFNTCSLYNPCPICDKCQNKASHLYVRCQSCQIPICTHKYGDRKFMIRRENFKIDVTDEVKDLLKEMGDRVNEKTME